MKRLTLISLLIANSVLVFAQSKSFQVLKDHFIDSENVQSFSVSGFLCRAALSMVADEEDELRGMMNNIDHIRFIIIPKEEFEKQDLSVNGFRNYLRKDAFEEVMSVRDHGDHINIFHRVDSDNYRNNKNRYFVLIEDSDKVVALELKGYIDPEMFKKGENRITFNTK
jgi:hypothetical protein